MVNSQRVRRATWLKRQGRRNAPCRYCGCTLDYHAEFHDRAATVDHFIPKSKGGIDRPDNWRVCCRKCNAEKGNMLPWEWLKMKGEKSQCT